MYTLMLLARPRRAGWIILAGAVLSCYPVAAAAAQVPGPSSVRQQLERVVREYAGRGLSLAHPIIEDDLADQQRDTVRVTLAGGSTYVIYGACDQDCTALHMQVRDEAGVALDSLTDTEDPILQMTSPRTQEYRIIVSPSCRMDPCRVGLAVFLVPPAHAAHSDVAVDGCSNENGGRGQSAAAADGHRESVFHAPADRGKARC